MIHTPLHPRIEFSRARAKRFIHHDNNSDYSPGTVVVWKAFWERNKHGECVWLLKEVKREIERVKFESNVKLNIRQLVNAILLTFIKEHSNEMKNNSQDNTNGPK